MGPVLSPVRSEGPPLMVVRSVPNICYFPVPSLFFFFLIIIRGSSSVGGFFLPFSFPYFFLHLPFLLLSAPFSIALLLSFLFFSSLYIFCYVFLHFRLLIGFLSSVVSFLFLSFSPSLMYSSAVLGGSLSAAVCTYFPPPPPPHSSALLATAFAHLLPSLVFTLPCSPCVLLLLSSSAFVCFAFFSYGHLGS